MAHLIQRPIPAHRPSWRRGTAPLLVLLTLLCTGCGSIPPRHGAEPIPATAPRTGACRDWYGRLDAAIERAGVRDAGAAAVPGHPFLRVDRFHASLRDLLPESANAATAAPVRAALMARLLTLDLQARQHEIANLPAPIRASLAGASGSPADAQSLLASTRDCGQTLVDAALGQAARTHAVLQALSVPPDYVDVYRAIGLYPLTRFPFMQGVRRLEENIRASFRQRPASDADTPRLRLQPPRRPEPGQVTPAQLRVMLQPPPDDPLGIPQPSAAQLETLYAHFAPTFELGVRSDDDRPGALVWPERVNRESHPVPALDIDRPVVYRQVAWTRHGQASLLQLVYTIWFGARTPTAWPIDLLAGRLDGLVWRVTLSAQGVPVMYDSIHPCGCYHQFFPPAWILPRPAPDPQAEWAFSPAQAPALAPGRHLVLRVAAATHYLDGLVAAPPQAGATYNWRDYDTLRSLPMANGARRSVFDDNGFIPGTDRAEAWLFWPMGIERAGAMRQWGRHATAFVGRRHFDDARLIEQRFHLAAPPRDD